MLHKDGKGDDAAPDVDCTMDLLDGNDLMKHSLAHFGLTASGKPLLVESHCAGVDAPVFGLNLLDVPVRVLVRSEIDPASALVTLPHHKGVTW